MDKKEQTQLVKSAILSAGFFSVGISKAGFLEQEAKYLEQWLTKNYHGEMQYMEQNFEKRTDPRKLMPECLSVISVMMNYFPKAESAQVKNAPKISKYAYGIDYHYVLKNRLKDVLEKLQKGIGEFKYRIFVDSAPVMDKVWAKKSGLGWIGKNTNLIAPQSGSFFFLGEILVDLEFEYDVEIKDFCGTCTRCIDSCPTQALSPYEIDARKCISYLTIELKDEIPQIFHEKMDNWTFGCDVCQDVCPWNRFSKTTDIEEFKPLDLILNNTVEDWKAMSNSQFNKQLKSSPMSRIKPKKWQSILSLLQK